MRSAQSRGVSSTAQESSACAAWREAREQAAGASSRFTRQSSAPSIGESAERRGVERLLAAVRERERAGRRVERAHEEGRLLHLDLAAEAAEL